MTNPLIPISQSLMERIDAGVEWLEENLPDWRDHFNVNKYDMAWANSCIMGQCYHSKFSNVEAYDSFERAVEHYFGGSYDRAEELGFLARDGDYDTLNGAWRQKFVELGMIRNGSES